MADKNIEKGDEVSWKWGGGKPHGTVAEIAEKGELSIKTNKGNTIKKNASPDDPAVHIERPAGNDVVKRAHELEVVSKADGGNAGKGKEDDDKAAEKENGEAKTGKKRGAETAEGDEDKEEGGEKSSKKQKTEKKTPAKKGRGRPKKADAEKANGEPKEKKEKKAAPAKRAPKKAATANGEPRRSARNKSS